MQVLSLIHQDDARAGVFADEVRARGHDLEEASLAFGSEPSQPLHAYDAVMVFGGSMNVDQEDRHAWLPEEKRLIRDLVERERPVLGVCLGAQLLAEAAGARVGPLPGGAEIGWREVDLLAAAAEDPVLGGLPAPMLAFEWHGYGVLETPAGMTELARNGAGVQAYRLDPAPAWGIQFHAEVDAPTVAKWVADDARDEGLDPDEMNEQIGRELPRWNELGRRLCGAFIEAARR